MKTLFRLNMITAALIAAMALAACDDDDDGPTGTGNDTTPPTVASASGEDSTHVNVRFSEPVDRTSAETEANYSLELATPPGTDVTVTNASLKSDGRTVVLTTSAMSNVGYTLFVSGVADTRGNTMGEASEKTFTGKATGDETAPEVVAREPSNNESNVDRNAPITITFSEPVSPAVFNTAFALSANGSGNVAVNVVTTDDVHYVVQPVLPLALNTEYSVSLVGVQDSSLNTMTNSSWTFHTEMTSAIATGVRH